MGLLQKANDNKIPLEQIHYQKDSGVPLEKKKKLIENFIEKVKLLKQGYEYSLKLFEELSIVLDFTKGALLLLDSEINVFVPITYKNLDLTTSRHLRIKKNILLNQFKDYNKIINISDSKIKLFKQYFSIREFSALNSIIILPFYNTGILTAILLVVDPFTEIVKIFNDITSDTEKFILKLIESQKPFSKSTKFNSNFEIPEPQLVLQEYIDNNNIDGISFLVVKINFTLLENALIKLLPNSESYNINNNIITSITQLISPTGKLIKINYNNYLLFYKIKTGKTSGIILHQINLAISTFFNLSEPLPPIEAEIKTIPDNLAETAESILEGLV